MKKIYIIFGCLFLICCIGLPTASAQAALNLKFFIEGFYLSGSSIIADTAVVQLRDSVSPYSVIQTNKGIFNTGGNMSDTFPNTVIGHSYYIVISHRNAIQTWSAAPVAMNTTTNYDFTTAPTQAYGSNMILIDTGPNIYGFYSGDVNQDGNIDLLDFIILWFGVNNGLFGYYPADLNGDGNVDLLDFPVLDANIASGIYIHRP